MSSEHSHRFSSDAAKINYIIGLRISVAPCVLRMLAAEQAPIRGLCTGCAADCLFTLHQGSRSLSEYAVKSGILASEAGWDEVALQAVFHQGLSECACDTLFSGTQPNSFDGLIDRAIEIDHYQHQQRRKRLFCPTPLCPRVSQSVAELLSPAISRLLPWR